MKLELTDGVLKDHIASRGIELGNQMSKLSHNVRGGVKNIQKSVHMVYGPLSKIFYKVILYIDITYVQACNFEVDFQIFNKKNIYMYI